MTVPKGMIRINIDIDEKTNKYLQQLADRERWSKRQTAKIALEQYLKIRGYKDEKESG